MAKKEKYPLVLETPLITIEDDTNINELQEKLPDNCFLLGEGGVYRYNKNKLYTSIIKMNKFSSLAEIDTGMKWNLPKLPFQILQETVTFFTKVYDEHKSESCVMLYYNFKTKKFKIGIPKQEVTATTIDYSEVPVFKGFTIVGSIHCHGSMSAFHSGTDDDDEMDFDGLHITVGTIASPTFACRFITNGQQSKIDIKKCVDMPSLLTSIDEDIMEKVSKKTYSKANQTHLGGGAWFGKSASSYSKTVNNVKETFKTQIFTYMDVKTGQWMEMDIMLLTKKERRNLRKWVNECKKAGLETNTILSDITIDKKK